jgi:hypothetical protein
MESGRDWHLRSHGFVALAGMESDPGCTAAEVGRCSLVAAGMSREVGAGMRPGGRSVEARYRNAPKV